MADILGGQRIIIDLTSVTKRVIIGGAARNLGKTFKIKGLTVDGIAPGAAGNLGLKEDSTGGAVLWQYTAPGAANKIHVTDYFEDCIMGTSGLYFADPDSDADIGAAWATGARLILYLA